MMSCAVLDNWYKISKIAFIMFFTSVKSLLIALNFFFFWVCQAACRILVPQPEIKHVSPASGAQSLHH